MEEVQLSGNANAKNGQLSFANANVAPNKELKRNRLKNFIPHIYKSLQRFKVIRTTFPIKPIFYAMKICPHCGNELEDSAIVCKNCGSDAETGWKDGAENADLELPDYEEIVENELGKKKNLAAKIATAVIVTVIALTFLLVFCL